MWKRIKAWLDKDITIFKVKLTKLDEEIIDAIEQGKRNRIKNELIATGKHGPKTGTVLSGQLLDEMARA